MDLELTVLADRPALLRYCEAVAGSVGEMTAAIFGLGRDSQTSQAAVVSCARKLGVAMQLTNILRDVGEDAARGRCYLPASELAEHGLTTGQVLDRTALGRRSRWEAFMKEQVSRARDLYREATPGIAMLATDAQPCASACAAGYATILDAIEDARYDTFTSRATASRLTLLGVAWQAWRGRTPAFGAPAIDRATAEAR